MARFTSALVLALGLSATAWGIGEGGGLFGRKVRVDPVRIRHLTEVLRVETDEKKRKAAVAELGEGDPRLSPEILAPLVQALQKDTSAAVRQAAAEAIGRFTVVFPVAGQALETAAESDASPAVRGAAKQALWDYHVNGYRSAKGADGLAGQTPEPPFARPATVRLPNTSEPLMAVPVPVVTLSAPPPTSLPSVGPEPGPRVAPPALPVNSKSVLMGAPPHPNRTIEPPIARPISVSSEPPLRTSNPMPLAIGRPAPLAYGVAKPPPLALDLPPIVLPPDGQ